MMASVVMADDGIAFDGASLEAGPLGGAETAFISLAEALAARGHAVAVHNNCAAPMRRAGVEWRPLADGLPDATELYIANRGHRLLPLVPRARARVFWIHNPAGYLLKWRYLAKLWRWRPAIVFSGAYHAASYPRWAPAGRRVTIPYGIQDVFRSACPAQVPPPPRAAFTSNPLRSLDWVLDRWEQSIRPAVPDAELHVFSSPQTYGAFGESKADAMTAVLDRAASMAAAGVVLREPEPKASLARTLTGFRALLYRGDPGETFCLAVGESQACGVPAVIQDVGCVAERIVDGITGFVAADADEFAARAIELLTDDALWRRQSAAAVEAGRGWSWDNAAAAFEMILPS